MKVIIAYILIFLSVDGFLYSFNNGNKIEIITYHFNCTDAPLMKNGENKILSLEKSINQYKQIVRECLFTYTNIVQKCHFLELDKDFANESDIHISFTKLHGPLAEALSSNIVPFGKIHYDNQKKWTKRKFIITTIHEIGHLFGLQHSVDVRSTMFQSVLRTKQQLLHNDILAIKNHYNHQYDAKLLQQQIQQRRNSDERYNLEQDLKSYYENLYKKQYEEHNRNQQETYLSDFKQLEQTMKTNCEKSINNTINNYETLMKWTKDTYQNATIREYNKYVDYINKMKKMC